MKLERTDLFYILAFIPILAVFYYSILSAVIPFYGFLLMLLKREKLAEAKKATSVQMLVGIMLVVASFFAYYAVVLVYREVAFYSPANYILHLLGLFLIFFSLPTLKEAFSPLFLIAAATSSTFISAWLKPLLSPFSNDFAHVIVSILRTAGVSANILYLGDIPTVTFPSVSGKMIYGAFVYECIGVYSMLVFSIILVVILLEDSGALKVKAAAAAIGLLGTFALNILRVTAIFMADYFYGIEIGATVHYVIGYVLFSIWLVFFFLAYSKRHFFKQIWQRAHGVSTKRDVDVAQDSG
jgi:exosortase/archaeosortase family protein